MNAPPHSLTSTSSAAPARLADDWDAIVREQMEELEKAGAAADLEASRYVSGLLAAIIRNTARLGTPTT